VFYATRQADGLEAAVKIIAKARLKPHERDFATVEVACLQRLNGHRNIIRLYQHVEDETNHYLFLELCRGGDLFGVIERNGKLPEATVRKVFVQLLEAVRAMHAVGVVHRDLKLENILLVEAGADCQRLVICDFGLSAIVRDTTEQLSAWVGSPEYASPELVLKRPYRTEPDVWALGVILYALAIGCHPFSADTIAATFARIRNEPARVPEHVSPLLRDLLSLMLIKDGSKRITIDGVYSHAFMQGAVVPRASRVRAKNNLTDKFMHAVSLRKSM
jgi:serine/threonine protein kinase